MPIEDPPAREPEGMPPDGQPLTREIILRWLGMPVFGPQSLSGRLRLWGTKHWRLLEKVTNSAIGLWLLSWFVIVVGGVLSFPWVCLAGMAGLLLTPLILFPTLQFQRACGLVRQLPTSARAYVPEFLRPLEPPSPHPDIRADGRGIYVGDVTVRRIDWWQIREIESRRTTWLVRWDGGTFVLDQEDYWHARVHATAAGVLLARQRRCPIPGDPAGSGIPETALSQVRMTGEPADERGLSRAEVETDRESV